MSNFDEIAEELFKRGQIIRDNWFRAWVANIDRMRQEFENSERFLSDYQHLLQPMAPPQPLRSHPHQDGMPPVPPPAGNMMDNLFGAQPVDVDPGPPPLPTNGSAEDDQAWFDRITARREQFPRR